MPDLDRELSPAGDAAMDAAIDAIEREDHLASIATAVYSLLMAGDETNASTILAELTAVERDRVAQAATRLALAAAPRTDLVWGTRWHECDAVAYGSEEAARMHLTHHAGCTLVTRVAGPWVPVDAQGADRG